MNDGISSSRLAVNGRPGSSLAVEHVAAAQDEGFMPSPAVIFLGGFYSSMHGTKAGFLSELCHSQGWEYWRFDYRGHGDSDGLAEDCTLHDWLSDTLQVIDHTRGPLILIGSSMGAWLALLAARKRPERLAGLITLAAAPDFTHELMWPALSPELQADLTAGQTITLPGDYDSSPWRVRQSLFDSGRELSLLDGRDTLDFDFPVRLIHGTADSDVPWRLSARLMDTIDADDLSLLLLKNADHRLSEEPVLQRIAETLLPLMIPGGSSGQQESGTV